MARCVHAAPDGRKVIYTLYMTAIKNFVYWATRVYLVVVLIFVCYLWFDPDFSLFSGSYNLFIMGVFPILASIPFGVPIALILLLLVHRPGQIAVASAEPRKSQRTKTLTWFTVAVAASMPLVLLAAMFLCMSNDGYCAMGLLLTPYYVVYGIALVVSLIALLLSSWRDKRRTLP